MTRGELAKAAAMALLDHDAAPVLAGGMNYSANFNTYWARAMAVLDAILPQVTTIEELEALPVGTKLLDDEGRTWTTHAVFSHIKNFLPLTVVWRP